MYCQLDENQINNLVQQYGSPLYIFHVDEFEENYFNLINTMRSIYPKYNIAYSYKTNYTPKICELVKRLGGLAEVVSDMEYNLAKMLGYDNFNIIYNGPVKGKGLFEHLYLGGVANIDSLDELSKVISFASKNPSTNFKVAFRVNIDIGQGFISRFGLDAYEKEKTDSELSIAFNIAKNQPNISVVGLHCHIGRSRNIESWNNRVRIMLKLVDYYFDKTPEFINFGSGMNSVMEPTLASQFDGDIPTFEEYASVLATSIMEKYGNYPVNEQPYLFTEPGTTLISGCVSFVATVQTIKNVKGKNYVTFDCSSGNMGDICHLKQLPISVYRNDGEAKQLTDATFVGYTCLEHDHIYEGFNGDLAVGDTIQFRNVGSYSNVFKPPFILPNCAMIQIDKDGNTELIKRKETIDDIFHTYTFDKLKMRDLTVLVTACGAQFMPGLADCLKQNGERKIRIVGVDTVVDQTVLQMVDSFYRVPCSTDPTYIDRLLEICKQENVDVVIPFMSSELIPIIERKSEFEVIGTKVSVSDKNSVKITNNKFLFYSFLKEKGLSVPKFAHVRTAKELISACEACGYPNNAVCVKATESSGSRGIRIIKPGMSRFDVLFKEKPNSFYTTIEELFETLNEKDTMPEMMVMEYLPGVEGSVDLIADNGKILYMAYRESTVNLHSIPQAGELKYNPEAYEIAEKVIAALKLTGSADLDFKNDADGHPVLMEINPRIAATMKIFKEGGLNLPYLRIKHLLGEELPKVDIKYGIKMKRRYLEMFSRE